ncbi:uncharacterized protein LOC132201785 [Neocloeon triangulifer]|uniref:uncharacterized protein LOC132201785 n=1 Tax=Neocloeon triangulifer TaxID=2078957 RepID=UPI00286F4449|nr:uncharacterized protein LOC132201785 [Neocloeon triangulifer]
MTELLCWLLLVLVMTPVTMGQNPQVTLPGLGTIEGYTGSSFINGRLFNRFRGVPFAKPPLGDLRFKAPEPVEPWTGILDAHTSFGFRCPQLGDLGLFVSKETTSSIKAENDTSENCLFLQLYTPTLDPSAKLPVIVFIHGGSFASGSSRTFAGDKFMDHDVILVIPHYRVGPIGFLNLQTDDIPGNAGLLDQVEALKWVQNYITFFGGDPKRVTVMGESAGSVSTTLLNLSPLSTNLFNQMIGQSGAAASPWMIENDPARAAQVIGVIAGCTDTEINAQTQCLKTVDPIVLSLAAVIFLLQEQQAGRTGLGGMAPSLQMAGAVRFLEKAPVEIYKSGEYNAKPSIFGANKHEGTLLYQSYYNNILLPNGFVNNTDFLKNDFTKFLLVDYLGIQDQGNTLGIAVENTYLGKENMGDLRAMTPGLIDLLAGLLMKGPTHATVEYNAAKGAPSYLYSFHFNGSNTLFNNFAPSSPIPGGISHGDEMILQFAPSDFPLDERDKIMSNKFLNLWVNFVKYGNPTPPENPIEGVPTWPTWAGSDQHYMVIDETSKIMQDYPQNDYFVSINENFFAVLILILVNVNVSQGQNPQVTLPGLGTLEGYTGKAYISDRPYFHFRGVPFAQPPVDALRFKAPQPVQSWDGILDAHSSFGGRCPQIGVAGRDAMWDSWMTKVEDNIFGRAENETKEDCLFLQVYSPNLDPSANLPVLVFFHGGAFATGSSRLYGGSKFLDHDVVLVVPHYRLGPLGFLSLHTDEIPGNAGMLDQVEALKWVQNYISYFGGNPNKVTVMGESAGGVSSSMLNLSPLSTNLFQQYISQSGSAIANWGLDLDPIRAASEIGTIAGCPSTEINALTACLQTIDVTTLNEAHATFAAMEQSVGRSGFAGCSPVVQKAGAVRFLERSPTAIVNSGEYNAKPGMFGATKHEGTLVYHFLYKGFLEPNGLVNDTEYMKRGITRTFLNFFDVMDQGDTLAISVEKTFYGAQNMGDFAAMTPGVVDFTSNMFIKGPVYGNALYNTAKGAPSYLYAFHFDGSRTLFPFYAPNSPIRGGVCHANELILQFAMPTFTMNAEDKIISNQIVSLWANFVAFGNPTPSSNPVEGIPTWPAWTPSNDVYLVINSTSSIAQDYTNTEYFVAINENFPYNLQ